MTDRGDTTPDTLDWGDLDDEDWGLDDPASPRLDVAVRSAVAARPGLTLEEAVAVLRRVIGGVDRRWDGVTTAADNDTVMRALAAAGLRG